ncbi:MAG: hypothetical protein F4X27_10810, partial [Chloroflexi bacterium]|nr:hypothetical protein [Chloroflexota bacterium]
MVGTVRNQEKRNSGCRIAGRKVKPGCLVGAIALAVLLALAVACGSDEPADPGATGERPTAPGAATPVSAAPADGTAQPTAGQTAVAPGTQAAPATKEPEPSPTPAGALSRAGSQATPAPEATPEPTPEPTPGPISRLLSRQLESQEDRETLIAIYNATGGENWNWDAWGDSDDWEFSVWLSDNPIGEWGGVSTDKNGRVTWLHLRGLGLTGEIPPEVADLSHLEALSLIDNQLSGEIPAELGSLENLDRLELPRNQLSGEIPVELGNIEGLRTLDLSNNQLTGEIPPELGRLDNLWELNLRNNRLTGGIPSELGDLHSSILKLWVIRGNNLSGCVPDVVYDRIEDSEEFWSSRYYGEDGLSGFLADLKVCDTTDHPDDRAALTAIYNAMGGADWRDYESSYDNYGKKNWLSAAPLGQWAGVSTDANGRVVGLELGDLTGEFPPEVGNLSSLRSLSASTSYSGDSTTQIPSALGNLSNLRRLSLNRFNGEIPPELWALTNLKELSVGGGLTGQIPPGLGNLTGLRELSISSWTGDSELTGEIPEELG